MTRIDPAGIAAEFERLEEELRRLAAGLAQKILQEELARRATQPSRGKRRRTRSDAAVANDDAPVHQRGRLPAPAPDSQQLALQLDGPAATAAEAPPEAGAPGPDAPPAPPPASAAAPASGKRRRWTREDIIEGLATSIINGTAVDARFMTRYGPPGLVAAARRIFGRFDAALNVASLRVTQLYPEGLPSQRTPFGRAQRSRSSMR